MYAKYRPTYPKELIQFLIDNTSPRITVWDCGCGNGQMSELLINHFDFLFATDISSNQIKNAYQNPKIEYSLQSAEKTNFDDRFFDLIVVAQAIHWFDFEKFYFEVNRTLKPDGLFAAVGYGKLRINKLIDNVIDDFYKNIIGPYWDNERKYVDEEYNTIPFPFKEMSAPNFETKLNWNFEHLIGYLNTWSAVKHYEKVNNENPVEKIIPKLQEAWGPEDCLSITFPILLRIGKLN